MFPGDSGIPIDRANMRWFDVSVLKLQKLDEAFDWQGTPAENVAKAALYVQHAAPDGANGPAYQPYAVVRVDGKVVAEIDNQGFVEVSNAVAAKLGGSLPSAVDGKSGPRLAQARAETIAEQLGGRVEKSATAMTQSQFDATDRLGYYERQGIPVGSDGRSLEALQKSAQAQTVVTAQQFAQSAEESVRESTGQVDESADEPQASESAESDASDPVKKFLEYMEMTPEERYYEAILREKGLTKEELAALPPEERERIEREIKEEIVERMAVKSAEHADRADA